MVNVANADVSDASLINKWLEIDKFMKKDVTALFNDLEFEMRRLLGDEEACAKDAPPSQP